MAHIVAWRDACVKVAYNHIEPFAEETQIIKESRS